MAIVVSDTSAIAALHHVGLTELLKSLFAEVFVPPTVAWELQNPRGRRPVLDVGAVPFISVRTPQDVGRVSKLQAANLDRGEAEAIVLAIELSADWILIDEEAGRRMATGLHLKPMGVLGILLQAKSAGFVQTVGPIINRLTNEIGFHISNELRDRFLRTAGE